MDPSKLNRTRQLVASSLGGAAIGKDRAMRLWLRHVDPVIEACIKPPAQWAIAVLNDRALSELGAGWRQASKALAARPLANRWRQARRPASAVLATLGRLGWHWPAYHTLITHTGYGIDLRRAAPA
eukprot:9138055-Pyramimonas_sp.AAC.1